MSRQFFRHKLAGATNFVRAVAGNVHRSQHATRRLGRGNGRRLCIEPLEDRRMLAAFTVTNLNDAAVTMAGQAPGTLRQALFDANNTPGADSIQFQMGLHGTITLTQGELDVTDDTTISGPGANLLTINAGGINSAIATNTVASINVSLSGLTITGVQMNGFLAGPAAIDVSPGNTGALTVQNSMITGNDGIGIKIGTGALTVASTTVSQNYYEGINAKIVSVSISNSLISDNFRAGMYLGGPMQIRSRSTVQSSRVTRFMESNSNQARLRIFYWRVASFRATVGIRLADRLTSALELKWIRRGRRSLGTAR